MNIPKYRRRSIIPLKGSIPRGKFKKPGIPEFSFIIEPDKELEAEIKSYKEVK